MPLEDLNQFILRLPLAAITLGIILLLSSCLKEKILSTEIRGKVVEQNGTTPIPYATVKLEVKRWIEGHTEYITLEEIQADENGEYTFRRDLGADFINAEAPGYFTSANTRQLIDDREVIDVELPGKTWLKIQVPNMSPSESDDHIRVYPKYVGESAFPYEFSGSDVNETLIGTIRSGESWYVRWIVTEGGNDFFHRTWITGETADTLSLLIAY